MHSRPSCTRGTPAARSPLDCQLPPNRAVSVDHLECVGRSLGSRRQAAIYTTRWQDRCGWRQLAGDHTGILAPLSWSSPDHDLRLTVERWPIRLSMRFNHTPREALIRRHL